MVARIQQLIAISLLAALIAALAFAVWTPAGWRLGALALAVVVGGYAGVLAVEFWLLWRSYQANDRDRPSLAHLARAWAREVVVAPRFFLWQQPFRHRSEPDHVPRDARGRLGIVLLHGFFCNRGLWNLWIRALKRAGVPVIAVSLEPVFGSIDEYGPTIAAAVERLQEATGRPPMIVAHSMGGLAARAWLATQASPRAHALITIASPHAGTRLARHGHGRNVAQMRCASEWLARLAVAERSACKIPTICFWSPCDNIVVPARSAILAGAVHRQLPATPHVAMICHPAVFDEVLGAARAAAS